MTRPVDIEAAITAVLTDNVGTGVGVGTKLPNPRPDQFVRVTALGGSTANLIQSRPRALIECFGAGETEAIDLARLAYSRLWAAQNSWLDDETWVSEIGLTDPVNFPDKETGGSRYQFIATPLASLV